MVFQLKMILKPSKRNAGGLPAQEHTADGYPDYINYEDESILDRISLKFVAFASVVLGTITITACCVTVPLAFNYVQQIQSTVVGEFEYCKAISEEMWMEIFSLDMSALTQHKDAHLIDGLDILLRATRQASNDECCACQQGQSGKQGQPGRDGNPGRPGEDGKPGDNGRDAEPEEKLLPVPEQCPCESDQGESGQGGSRGQDGSPGAPGRPGETGEIGEPGEPGPPGFKGQPGSVGPKGNPGEPGALRDGPRPPPGRPGTPGRPGAPGEPGTPGDNGIDGSRGSGGKSGQVGPPGINGRPGEPGTAGDPGLPGAEGSCEHCPPARLEPGYARQLARDRQQRQRQQRQRT